MYKFVRRHKLPIAAGLSLLLGLTALLGEAFEVFYPETDDKNPLTY
jgi:hypothetical protein